MIERDGGADDRDVAPVEMQQQHRDDQHQFDDGRRQLQQHHAHDGLDGVAATLEHAGQPAGLALEMEAQRQQMHVLEGEHRQPPHRVHRHFGENAVAPLRQQPHDDAHAAIGERHHHRRGERPGEPIAGRNRRGAVAGERIGRPFEGEGHRHGGELGEEQQHGRENHAAPSGRAGRSARYRATAAQASRSKRAAVATDFALDMPGRSLKIAHRRSDSKPRYGRNGRVTRRPDSSRVFRHIELFAALRIRTGRSRRKTLAVKRESTPHLAFNENDFHEQNQCGLRLLRIEPGHRAGLSSRPRIAFGRDPGRKRRAAGLWRRLGRPDGRAGRGGARSRRRGNRHHSRIPDQARTAAAAGAGTDRHPRHARAQAH